MNNDIGLEFRPRVLLLLLETHRVRQKTPLPNILVSYQLKLKEVPLELANLYHCAVSFLSRAAVNLSWYDIHVRPNVLALTIFIIVY